MKTTKTNTKTPVSFKICLCFIPFIFVLLSPPSLLPSFPPSLPPPLWSGDKGIFITLISSPFLACPFEVWLPAPRVEERILATAGFLLLFLCIYKFASLSFLFFCFICLCFPSLIKPASLPLTGSPSLVDHYHLSIFLLQSLSGIIPFSLLYLILSILSSFLPSFICLLRFFSPSDWFWHVFSVLSKMFLRLVLDPWLNWRKAWKWTRRSFGILPKESWS